MEAICLFGFRGEERIPAKRTTAPALGLLTLSRMEGMSNGKCVSETEIPSAVSRWGSAR